MWKHIFQERLFKRRKAISQWKDLRKHTGVESCYGLPARAPPLTPHHLLGFLLTPWCRTSVPLPLSCCPSQPFLIAHLHYFVLSMTHRNTLSGTPQPPKYPEWATATKELNTHPTKPKWGVYTSASWLQMLKSLNQRNANMNSWDKCLLESSNPVAISNLFSWSTRKGSENNKCEYVQEP